MKNRELEARISALFEDSDSEPEGAEAAALFESEPEAESMYREYHALLKLEQLVAQEPHVLDEDFVDVIMEAVATESQEEVPESYRQGARLLISSLVAANVVLAMLLVALVSFNPQHAVHSLASAIGAGREAPVQLARLTPIIFETSGAGHELPRPDDFVHLSVSSNLNGSTQTVELAHFLKVAAVDASKEGDNYHARVTVMVPSEKEEKIHLARLLGEVQLSLSSPYLASAPSKDEAMTIRDPMGRTIVEGVPAYTQAVLYLPTTEKSAAVRRVLDHGKWKDAEQSALLVF